MNHNDLQHGLDADYDDLAQYASWTAQEKYRGVRVFWDGYSACTRQGKPIALPDAAEWQLPEGIALDCELYDGIDGESRCATAVRWGRFTKTMRLIAFDLPGSRNCWSERIEELSAMAHEWADHPRLQFAPVVQVQTEPALQALLAEVLARGGEGLMLRHADALYEPGRTTKLIKVKYSA